MGAAPLTAGQRNRAFAVCTPFHLLRVLLTLVPAMKDAHAALRLDPITPDTVPWTKAVFASQGSQQLPRHAHIAQEWSRITKYQANGSLCSFTELAEYLRSQLLAEGGSAP